MKVQSPNIILKKLSDELVKTVGEEIYSIICYGSTARGTATKDSDIDVAIIVQNENNDLWKEINEIAARYSLNYDCLISILLISRTRYEEMRRIKRLLARNLSREGKILWQKTA